MTVSLELPAAENPFPAQAVTTFGAPPTSAVELRSFRDAKRLLTPYLANWAEGGAALAMSGAYGAGKTFLLEQLAAHLQAQTVAAPQVVYVKADTTSFVDLYRLILAKLSRDRLVELVTLAIRLRAQMVTGAAKSTLAASEAIQKDRTVDPAYAKGVLDPNVMRNWLRSELEQASTVESVSQRVSAVIGLLDHATAGNAAYQWLEGADTGTALPNSALATPLLGPVGAESVDAMIATLECLARLHALAERPLVLMVDQAEALLGANTNVDNSSFVKKFVEQLKAANAIVILAGTPGGWRRLPVDAGPRLWTGEPLRVGALEDDESLALVNAFSTHTRYSRKGLAALREITGGNPRAILQTSHQVFKLTDGRLEAADEAIIGQGFEDSGMLRDSARAAFDILKDAAGDHGFEVRPAYGKGAGSHDMFLTAPGGRSFLATVVQFPDRVRETTEAARLTELRGELAEREPDAGMVVVGVGYTTDIIRGLIANIAEAVIPYDEATYLSDLQPVLGRLAAPLAKPPAAAPSSAETSLPLPSPPPPAVPSPAPDPDLLRAQLDRLQGLIGEVERLRTVADVAASERFSTDIARIAEPEVQRAKVESREEIREGLDRLWDLLMIGNPWEMDQGRVQAERREMRKLMIFNESSLKDHTMELLGGLYLQAANQALRHSSPGLYDLRRDILREMRISLFAPDTHWLEAEPLRSILCILAGVLVAAMTYAFVFALGPGIYLEFALPFCLAAGVVVSAAFWVWSEFRRKPSLRYRRLAQRLTGERG